MPPSQRHDRPSIATAPARSRSTHERPVVAPFRLDLTVLALRRLPTNVVDVLTPDGHYVHAFTGAHGPVIARVAQPRADALRVTIESDARDAGEHERAVALVRRTLGVDRDLTPFTRAAAGLPWLSPLARRMRGVKPPRYRTLWEAFVNAIVFQQVSLHAASAIARRLIVALGTPFESEGTPLYLFPTAQRVLGATDAMLRGFGLSTGKIAALRRAGEALESGALDDAMLEALPSPAAAALLRRIKGIGPWTATVILLRGLGRLDVFPMNDTSVARNIALVAGDVPLDVSGVIETLRPQQGMLYYHLLLARLDARGEAGRPSLPFD
jgi:DNA-3-methyladenine glycosylase II